MKKIISLTAIGMMMFGAGNALAYCGGWCSGQTNSMFTESESSNFQEQTQNINGVDFGSQGALSVVSQDQNGYGNSYSSFGSSAWEGQVQGENTNIILTNGSATHSYDQTVVTYGGSSTNDWGYSNHNESQSLDSGIFTVGDGNGQFSISGQATVGDAYSSSSSYGLNSSSNSGTFALYNNSYEYKNIDTNSGIVQSGFQAGRYETNTSVDNSGYWWNLGGNANASVDAQQVGGTAALNNGNGTYMAGGGVAEGSVNVSAHSYDGSWYYNGNVDSSASAEQVQQHTYNQTSTNGSQSQWATGTVGTYNQASVYTNN